MAISTVNISFQEELLEQIDKIVQDESRTRSELIREAARIYMEKKKNHHRGHGGTRNLSLPIYALKASIEPPTGPVRPAGQKSVNSPVICSLPVLYYFYMLLFFRQFFC
jgi:Arc/MetJ-type ribon-helix-helix transcriptional regulator